MKLQINIPELDIKSAFREICAEVGPQELLKKLGYKLNMLNEKLPLKGGELCINYSDLNLLNFMANAFRPSEMLVLMLKGEVGNLLSLAS